MDYKKIGIIGGMGPAAGLYFAEQLIELNVSAVQDDQHVKFILCSDGAIPSRNDAFLLQSTSPAPKIIDSLVELSTLGATLGVIICNTAHIYFDEIVSKVQMPIINMIENAADYISAAGISSNIGLLATTATVKSGIYSKFFEKKGVHLVVPEEHDQDIISSIIFDKEFGIKATGMTVSYKAIEKLLGVAERMRHAKQIDCLLLGCTELSLAIKEDKWQGFSMLDPVRLLAKRCIEIS